MKKYIIFLFITLVIISVSSCSDKRNDNKAFVQSEDDYYVYTVDKLIRSFDIDEDGNVYYLTEVDAKKHETLVDINGEEYTVPIQEMLISAVNKDGELIDSYVYPGSIGSIAFGNDKLYCIEIGEAKLALFVYPLDSMKPEKVCDIDTATSIKDIEVIGDRLYFLGVNDKYATKEYSLIDYDDGFTYSGEVLCCVDLNTGEITELPIEFPVSFSEAPDGSIVVYAHDDEGGFYFTVLDTNTLSLGDKVYHDKGMMDNYTIYNNEYDYIYVKIGANVSLAAASLEPDKGHVELVPDFRGGSFMKCHGEYTYMVNINQTRIIRIKNATYIRGNEEIVIFSPESYDTFTPFGCGYRIKHEFLTDEEMALALLSLDESFDVSFMNSRQDISENIRDKGSFYPLNDVKGVMDYLDRCHPYIKEAATDAEGNIWMLPISVDISCLVYDKEKAAENGMDFTLSMEAEDFSDIIKQINSDKELHNKVFYFKDELIDDYFYQYLRSYKTFNTDVFRKLAGFLKSEVNYTVDGTYGKMVGNIGLSLELSNDRITEVDFIFTYHDLLYSQYRDASIRDVRGCGTPSLTDNKTNIASCFYLCVNPSSKNLESALQYISSLCSYLSTKDDTFMFADRSIYPEGQDMDDLYSIYSNGDIQFTYPDDLYKDHFERYLKDEIDLDTFIEEADNRMRIYLNE